MFKPLQINDKFVLIQIGLSKISYYSIFSKSSKFQLHAFDEYFFDRQTFFFMHANIADIVRYSHSFLKEYDLIHSYVALSIDFSQFSEKIIHENDKAYLEQPHVYYRNDLGFKKDCFYLASLEQHFFFRFLLLAAQLPIHFLLCTSDIVSLLEALSFLKANVVTMHYETVDDIYNYIAMVIKAKTFDMIESAGFADVDKKNLIGALGLFVMAQRMYEQYQSY